MSDNTVIPNFESVPERVYKREGGLISCFEIEKIEGSATAPIHTYGTTPLFTISLTERQAEMLMNDLYYGEYTGA